MKLSGQPGRPDDGYRDVDAVVRDRAVFDVAGRELDFDQAVHLFLSL